MTGNETPRLLRLAGRIDDASGLAGLVEQVRAAQIVIDTGGVIFINSIGVREWMRFLRGLAATGAQIQLDNVAEVLVTQMNLIPDLRAGATISSVYAPYACEKCGAELSQLVEIARHVQELRELRPPTFPCPECGGTLTLADYPDRYFSFLRG